MEDQAIREGFKNLRPGTEFDRLYKAALCRAQADWVVGINATRLFSCAYNTGNKMFFNKGDCIEISGGCNPKLFVYAGEELIVCRDIFLNPGHGYIMTNNLEMYSNNTADYQDTYWIKKIQQPEIYQVERRRPLGWRKL